MVVGRASQGLDCLMIAVCETVVEDKQTSNKSLINLFNNINAGALPARHPRVCVVVTLTNGHGRVPLSLTLKHVDSGDRVFGMDGGVQFDDSESVKEIVFDLQGLIFNRAGDYLFELRSGDQLVAYRKIHVQVPGGR